MVKNNSRNTNNKFPHIPHEDIAWVALRMLWEEFSESTINEEFRNKFNEKVDMIYHLPYIKKRNLIDKWLNFPYVYKGSLLDYEKNNKSNS